VAWSSEKMKNSLKNLTYGEHFALGHTEWSWYGKSISIKDYSGESHQCYCTDENVAKLISSLPKRKSRLAWSLSIWPRRGDLLSKVSSRRGFLRVSEIEHGFLVYRQFRSNGRLDDFVLAHQLTGTPIVFPSLEFGKAAAELVFLNQIVHLAFFGGLIQVFSFKRI
jgi:hypothetical protein